MPERLAQPLLDRTALQAAMSRDASVMRDATGLARLTEMLTDTGEVDPKTRRGLEDAALTVTAQAVVAAASARTESRGCHHRSDFAGSDPARACSSRVRRVGGLVAVETPAVVGS